MSLHVVKREAGPGSLDDPYATDLGAKVLVDGSEEVVVVLDVERRHCNDLGRVHGGAIISLADVALSIIANQSGTVSVATGVSAHLVSAARVGDRLVAQARPEHRGGRLAAFVIRVTAGDRMVALVTGQTLAIGQRGEAS